MKLLERKNKSIKLGKYRHFKGGIFEVIGLARHSETLELMVVYRHQGETDWWVRPEWMFNEIAKHQGKKILGLYLLITTMINLCVEKLYHFRCQFCKKWWTVGDALKKKKKWYCPWCGQEQKTS